MIDPALKSLVSMCANARMRLASTGRALHDDVGPLLAGAGMHLSAAAEDPAVKEALGALQQAMEQIRALSQELNPSPVDRLGLKTALEQLMEKLPGITLDYQAKARPPREAGALLYEMALYALKAAAESGADTIILKVTGEKAVTVRVIDDGKSRQRKNVLAIPVALAEAMGLRVTITTGKSTIVSISHAARSTTSRRP